MGAHHLSEVTQQRAPARLRRGVVALVPVALAVGVAACGAGHSAAGTHISGTIPSGDSTFSNPHYTIAIPPGLQHFDSPTGPTGRQANVWDKGRTVLIEATYDPHPVTLATAVGAVREAARSDHQTHVTVSDANVAGARSARLITHTGQPPKFFASNAELILLTGSGAMLDVSVSTDGRLSPMSVINSITLKH
jgi:hypothetical protein